MILFEFSLFIENWLVFLAIFLVFFIGILDDHKDTSPKQKILVIFLASLILYFDGVHIESLGSFFGFEIPLGYIAFPLSLIFLVGFTNALNLVDGLDGLSASISIVILSTFLYIGYLNQNDLMIAICLFTIVSLCAFLVFNWNPASIFMGDSGSLFLGFVIAAVALMSLQYIDPVILLYLLSVPTIDTFVVMTRRIKKNKSPFSADKTHIHHILLNFFAKKVKRTVLLLLLFIGIVILSYMIFTGMKRRQKLIEKLAHRRKRALK